MSIRIRCPSPTHPIGKSQLMSSATGIFNGIPLFVETLNLATMTVRTTKGHSIHRVKKLGAF
ncbi:hypothetical protein Q4603_17870 [Zobellia galactanivorans]|uniref:hypothetical protein n=1 Tax=Zobellia TaxID=112040 RepID=UPI000F512FFA|nr:MULTISPECIES: hypothetical protein [Zobellia]MDO6810496.1 hypothetical protein [Zobellia galactanivorans]